MATEVKMRKAPIHIIGIFLAAFLLSGCMKLALRASPSLFPNFTTSIFEECDAKLARASIPANLKMLEGLLKSDPTNRQILATLSMGFVGYSMLFVEEDDPERASQLYLRARDYGLRALGPRSRYITNPSSNLGKVKAVLADFGRNKLEALLWTAVSWNAWIYLNLDKPAAIAQLKPAEACLKRMIEIDPDYLYGLPRILMGVSFSARPPMFGGNIEEAKSHFEKALALSDRKFFLGTFYLAKYYAVRVQNRALFLELINEISQGNPQALGDVCLMNTVIQAKALRLKDMAEDLFF